MKDVRLLFEDLIAPVTRQDFLASYWEQGHLHLRRGDPCFYESIFSLADVDRAISSSSGTQENLDIIPSPDSGRKMEKFRPAQVSMDKIYASLGRGDTIRLMGVQQTWPPLANLAASIGESLSADVNFNFYLTPAGSQGFPIHVDTHEALILQVEGTKEWFIYAAEYPLPLNTLGYPDDMKARIRSPLSERDVCLVERIHLARGDLLYIPRGVPHKAVASVEPSLHLTAGIHPLYWVDFLKRALELVCGERDDLRKALPPGYPSDAEVREQMAEVFNACLNQFFEQASFERTLETLVKTRLAARPFPPDGHVEQIFRLGDLHSGSVVERRAGLDCLISRSEGVAVINFASGEMRGPLGIAPALEYIRDHRRFRIADLPSSLPEQSKLVLVRRLVREGLLRAIGQALNEESVPSRSLSEAAE